MALDEIVLIANRRCSPVSEFGDLVTHYCDFETDECGYTISQASEGTTWKRAQPELLLPGVYDSPPYDNSLQTQDGYYMKLTVIFTLFFYSF